MGQRRLRRNREEVRFKAKRKPESNTSLETEGKVVRMNKNVQMSAQLAIKTPLNLFPQWPKVLLSLEQWFLTFTR